MKSKLISIIGPPSSGKSTLASDVHTELKKMGKNSIFIPEAATDFIAEFGIPNNPIDQIVVFYNQLNRETMYGGTKEFIMCDSSTILNYFYFRNLFPKKLSNKDVASINHLQKEILKSLNNWYRIFFVPPILGNTDDGIRYQTEDEIKSLSNKIKTYLEIENIEFVDLSDVDINKRNNFILKNILD
jgi:nicotinamide riboside kinase